MKKFTFMQFTITGFAVAIILLSFQKPGHACTLWAAAGNSVVKGGTLIAKNRDWEPNHSQELKVVRFKNRFRFIGLYDQNSEDDDLKAGVNEYGLVIINAIALDIPLRHHSHTNDLMERILSHCKNIPDVLHHRNWFRGARFLLLADRKSIMTVEIGPNGMPIVKTTDSATFCHTNHYIEPGFKIFNSKLINESSLDRYNFIREYLQSKKIFSLKDFVRISRSKTNGPDNSLWRIGKNPGSTRTMASWIVWQPVSGRPVLFVRLANPHERVQEYFFDLNQLFWDNRFFPITKFHSRRIL